MSVEGKSWSKAEEAGSGQEARSWRGHEGRWLGLICRNVVHESFYNRRNPHHEFSGRSMFFRVRQILTRQTLDCLFSGVHWYVAL